MSTKAASTLLQKQENAVNADELVILSEKDDIYNRVMNKLCEILLGVLKGGDDKY